MSNDYFAVATDSHFDPVFKARDEATVKTIDRSTFWTIAPSRAFCQKCKQRRLKAIDEYSVWVFFSNIGRSLPIRNDLDEEQ